jgi:hypothetical protein
LGQTAEKDDEGAVDGIETGAGRTTPLLTIQALKALKSVVVLTDAGRLRG